MALLVAVTATIFVGGRLSGMILGRDWLPLLLALGMTSGPRSGGLQSAQTLTRFAQACI